MRSFRRPLIMAATLLATSVVVNQLAAQQISLNFSENSANQGFAGGQMIGPLLTDSATWNNTSDQGSAASGSMFGLINSAGATTGVSVDWSSSNTWYNSDGTANDNTRLAVGYLDDGGTGVSVTFTNIPYATYRVYGLLASDQGNQYNTVDFTVNGAEVFGPATSAPAFGNIATSLAETGQSWSLANGTTRGNYWSIDTSGSSLTIQGAPRDGANRGSLSGVIIRDLSVPVFDPALKLTVNRTTGVATLTNNTGATVNLAGLSMTSTDGAWAPASWTSITSTYDQGGSVSSDAWIEFARSPIDLSEGTLGTGALAQGQSVSMGAIWTRYYKESSDLRLEYLNAGTGETVSGLLEFTGNGGNPLPIGDFNGDGSVTALDWPTMRNNFNTNHAGLYPAQSYRVGDLTADGETDANDLIQFKTIYDAANGAGAFAAMVAAVPEPSSLALVVGVGLLFSLRTRAGRTAKGALLLLVACLATASTASAQNGIGVNFVGGRTDNDAAQRGPDVAGAAGVAFSQNNWNNVGGNFPATDHDATVTGLLNSSGANSGASITWSTDETWTATGDLVGNPSPDQDRNLMGGYLDAIPSQPTVTALMQNIPYAAYDVYVYVGSDGDGRLGHAQINDSISSNRWFRTSSSAASFTSAANYLPANATTAAAATAGNYVVYQDVVGPELLVGVTRDTVNVGLHGIQIVQELNPQILKLEVNTTTGLTTIRNQAAAPISLDYFEIASASSALDEAGWTPLGTGTVNGSNWEVLGNLDDSLLAQFFLGGATTLAPGQSLSLGSAYDGAAQDLVFRYNDPNSFTRRAPVTYVGGSQPGDFNGDLEVDGADFLVWQRGVGTTHNAATLAQWKANFGAAVVAGAAVPEPSSLALLAAALGSIVCINRRRQGGAAVIIRSNCTSFRLPVAVCCALALSSVATAGTTNDRFYRMGEGAGENASAGAVVGSGHSIPNAGDTLDDVGPAGAYLDLVQSGDPRYISVTSGPKVRTGAPAGGLAVQFDGVDDLLDGIPLNRPDELATLVGGSYPLNYTGITERGLQGWVYPDLAGINEGTFQSIVFDSIMSGGPAINAAGQWTQINSWHSDVDPVPASVPAVANAWSHVMHHNYFLSEDTYRSILYVNGIAVSGNDDYIAVGGDPGVYVGRLVVGAAEVPNDGVSPLYSNNFQGAVDDLKMYVVGNNTAQGGQNYGTFNLFADNEWIANRIATTVPGGVLKPGDVNRDGVVNGTGFGPVGSDDVSAFIAGWRDRKTLQGAHNSLTAGDWETWGWGDMNHDGIVGFADWFILRANHPTPASINLEGLLAGVPEPNSAILATLALVGLGIRRKR